MPVTRTPGSTATHSIQPALNSPTPLSRARTKPSSDAFDEAGFQRYLEPEKISLARIACILAMVLVVSFGTIDLWALESAVGTAWAIRAATAFACAATLGATWSPLFLRHYDVLMTLPFAGIATGMIALTWLAEPHEAARILYIGGGILLLPGICAMSFLRRSITGAFGLFLLVGYVAAAIEPTAAGLIRDLPAVLTNGSVLVASFVIGVIGQNVRTHYARESFVRQGTLQRELQAKEEAMRLNAYLSTHDELSGLPNRKQFTAAVDAMIAAAEVNSRAFAVLFIDLDGFKAVNDTHGHAAGDEVLRRVGGRLKRFAVSPACAARLGGDEFAVLIGLEQHGDDAETAQAFGTARRIAQSVSEHLSQPMTTTLGTFTLGASAGVAVFPHSGRATDALLAASDQDMYAVKRVRRQASNDAPSTSRVTEEPASHVAG